LVPYNAANAAARASRRVLDQAMPGMQANWEAQNELAARDGIIEDKVYLDNRYVYKSSGDFKGMYVMTGTLITIGDKDYVENRVLREVGRRMSIG
jgi:hypothetical protein